MYLIAAMSRSNTILNHDFYRKDVLEIARELPGKCLVRQVDGQLCRYGITDVEAYRGEEDQASHARRGRTPRTRVMYHEGGILYVYLVYGMHWMLNIVTGPQGHPQALLIRGLSTIQGPGRLTKALGIDRSFNAEDLTHSQRIWIEEVNGESPGQIITRPRVGIDYAGKEWREKPWRFILKNG